MCHTEGQRWGGIQRASAHFNAMREDGGERHVLHGAQHFAGVGLVRNASPACHFRALDPSVVTAACSAGELLHHTGSLWTTYNVSLTPARLQIFGLELHLHSCVGISCGALQLKCHALQAATPMVHSQPHSLPCSRFNEGTGHRANC